MDRMYYHISNQETLNLFVPRIPENRLPSEDGTIGRISVSTSVIGCLNGYPGNGDLSIRMDQVRQTNTMFLLYVYAVHETDMPKEYVYHPELLKENYGLKDALQTEEHWIVDTELSFPIEEVFNIVNLDCERIIGDGGSYNKVYNIQYEKSIEHYDRIYQYHFWEQEHANELYYLLDADWIINEFIDDEDDSFIIEFIIPANKDMKDIWLYYSELRKKYARNYYVQSSFKEKKVYSNNHPFHMLENEIMVDVYDFSGMALPI